MSFKHTVSSALLLVSASAWSANGTLTIELPRLQVAEYHPPYVAAWLSHSTTRDLTNLMLWYQLDDKHEGDKWLKDLRQWWRRSGRTLPLPVDGFSSATRRPGSHTVGLAALALNPGEYTLFVEASREVGGRELLQLPFSWPAAAGKTLTTKGRSELGNITLRLEHDQ